MVVLRLEQAKCDSTKKTKTTLKQHEEENLTGTRLKREPIQSILFCVTPDGVTINQYTGVEV